MFEYICETCGKGTVRDREVKDFETRIDGVRFIVARAVIGICDNCGSRHFNAKEWKLWRKELLRKQESDGQILSSDDIKSLRKDLGVTIATLAQVIGCSRQSLYYWESASRKIPQSRLADLMLKLVRESCARGSVNVLSFLCEDANARGIVVRIKRHERTLSGVVVHPPESDVYRDINPRTFESLFPVSSQPSGFSPCIVAVA